jgi:signal transduction histidine kinase
MSTQAQTGSREEILVVDDEVMICTMVQRFLTHAGYTGYTATTAADALRLCQERAFAVILTDLKMPEMSGTELIGKLRALYPTTEIIVMTGYPTLESAIHTLREGVADYILKPFTFDALQSVITQCLERRRLRNELASERQLRQELEEANRVNARLRHEAEENAVELRRLSVALRDAQEAERQRIARDLHDSIVQSLSLMAIRLDLLDTLSGAAPSLQQPLVELRDLLTQTLDDARSLVWTLRPRVLDDLGLADALAQLVENTSKIAALDISLHMAESLPPLSPAVTTALYRICQEALANVVQHAHATTAHVQVECVADVLRLTITDNGQGFEVTRMTQAGQQSSAATLTHRGLGLWSMRERATEVGSTVRINSTLGQGTTIMVELPSTPSEQPREEGNGTRVNPTR